MSKGYSLLSYSLCGKKINLLSRTPILSLEEQRSKFYALNDWCSTKQGVEVNHAFFAELNPLKDLLHGDTLLQLGRIGDNFFYKLRFQHKWLVTPYLDNTSTAVMLFNQIPLDRDSIDCLIAPLTLDILTSKSILDEIDRVLKPLGYVIFFGINPISLWGCWLRKANKKDFKELSGKPTSVLSVKRAMLRRGYIQCHLSTFYYVPPCRSEKWLKKLEIFNEIGKMISPFPAGFYCLVMQKLEENLIGPIHLEGNEKEIPNAAPVSLQPTCKR
ncbi:methyltransferase domain-containing protein [Legionella sp. CNM-1927-20]|uniref:methyltransferase domain-containing protein n=1 Tax=Legionella sp. CNM-1927-20 TaxID=3422221 RepID=UPI00403B2DFE